MEACHAWLLADKVTITINWPAQQGTLSTVCQRTPVTQKASLVCVRGSLKELCEIVVEGAQVLEGQLSITCSARTVELYEQRESGTSYVTTLRGKAADGAYIQSIALPASRKAVLRLLSLQQPGSFTLHDVQLLAAASDLKQVSSAQPDAAASTNTSSEAARSQKAEVAAMLQSMMASGPPGASTGSGDRQDAQQKLVAALAKAALGQSQPRKPAGAPWAFGRLLQQQQEQPTQQSSHQAPQMQADVTSPQQAAQQLSQQDHQQPAAKQKPLIQEVDGGQASSQSSASAGTSALRAHQLPHLDGTHGDNIDAANTSLETASQPGQQQTIDALCARMQVLEAASVRMEAKLDKILQFCSKITGG